MPCHTLRTLGRKHLRWAHAESPSITLGSQDRLQCVPQTLGKGPCKTSPAPSLHENVFLFTISGILYKILRAQMTNASGFLFSIHGPLCPKLSRKEVHTIEWWNYIEPFRGICPHDRPAKQHNLGFFLEGGGVAIIVDSMKLPNLLTGMEGAGYLYAWIIVLIPEVEPFQPGLQFYTTTDMFLWSNPTHWQSRKYYQPHNKNYEKQLTL